MIKTLADVLAANESLWVNCSHPLCSHSHQLDVRALADRLGENHGAMHNDLVRLFRCARCKTAGRDRRAVFFTCIPDYEAANRRAWTNKADSERY